MSIRVGGPELLRSGWPGRYCPECGADLAGVAVADPEFVLVVCDTCGDGWHPEELTCERSGGLAAVWALVDALRSLVAAANSTTTATTPPAADPVAGDDEPVGVDTMAATTAEPPTLEDGADARLSAAVSLRQAAEVSAEIEALLERWWGPYWGGVTCPEIGGPEDIVVYNLLADGLKHWSAVADDAAHELRAGGQG